MTVLDLFELVTLWVGVKAAVLVGFAYGATRLLKRSSAAVRHAIWALALTGVLIGPTVGSLAPSWHLEPVSRWVSSWDGSVSTRARPAGETGLSPDGAGPVPAARVGVRETARIDGGAGGAGASGWAAGRWLRPGRSAAGILLVVWAGGVLLLLLRLGLAVARISRISRAADPVSGALADALDDLRDQGGGPLRRAVRIRCTDQVNVPVTWGLLRPEVLLPAEARQWPERRLRVVCRHELAHAGRWDYGFHLVARLARAVAWPNPLVWWAVRRLDLEQEEACDDRVVRSGVAPADYADHLLALLRAWHEEADQVRGALTLAPDGGVKGRIRRLLDERRDRRPLGVGALALVLLVGGCVSVPVLGFRAEAERDRSRFERHVWIEAEDGWLQRPIRAESDVSASGWRYLEVEDDRNSRDDPPESGRVSYEFELEEGGRYRILGRVHAPDGGSDSFWIRVDEGPWVRWNDLESEDGWVWQPVHDSDREGDPVVKFDLQPGAHTLELAYREEETRVDRFVLTADSAFSPRGRGPLPPDHRGVRVDLEPESGTLHGPMKVVSDSSRGIRYVGVPDGPGNDPPGGGTGWTELRFRVPRADTYVVWGRVRGPRQNDNSFFVSVDGGEELVWDVPGPEVDDTSEEWTWDVVSARAEDGLEDPVRFQLGEGTHRLRIRNREDGASLDRVLITNEPIDPAAFTRRPVARVPE